MLPKPYRAFVVGITFCAAARRPWPTRGGLTSCWSYRRVPYNFTYLTRMPTSKPRERWADEACFEVNRERMHVPLRAYESRAAVLGRRLCDELPAGPWLLALTPARWSFSLASKPADAPSVSGPGGFDAAGWGDLQVPCSWEVAGVGSKPVYLNERYPFKLDPPRVPTDERNEVGSYQVSFTLPARWIGRRSYLVLDGLGSAATVWIDGAEVGYSQDSRLPAEFEVTKLVSAEGMSASEHVLSVQVVRYSDGSYLEDQDQVASLAAS